MEDVHHLMYADDIDQYRFSAGKRAPWFYYTNKIWKCVLTNTPVAGLYLISIIDILRVLVRILMLEFHFSMTVHLKICENTWRLKSYAKLMICSAYELGIKFFYEFSEHIAAPISISKFTGNLTTFKFLNLAAGMSEREVEGKMEPL